MSRVIGVGTGFDPYPTGSQPVMLPLHYTHHKLNIHMKFRVTLARNQEHVELDYETYNHRYVDDWIMCFRESNKIPRQKNRVHGFSLDEAHKKILAVNDTISKLNELYDGLIDSTVSSDNTQNDVNYIHSNFVELHQGRIDCTNESAELWDTLNQQLHSCEADYNQSAFIFFEIEDTKTISIPEDAYPHFTLNRQYGDCYMSYYQVGRHIAELFYAKDADVDPRHIKPFCDMSATGALYFGKNRPKAHSRQWPEVKKWYNNHLNDKFHMNWGDPKLAIGMLPVAKLLTDVTKDNLMGVESIISMKEI